MSSSRSHNFNGQGFLPNGASGGPPAAQASNLLPNNGRVVQTGGVRVLCVADVRGNLRSLNDLAKQARADHIIHTGDFGFYDESSLERIADKTLKHVAQYSPLLSEQMKKTIQSSGPPQPPLKQRFTPDQVPLSELSSFLNNTYSLDIPVYTVWGACEDVRVLEKFRSGEYKVKNLHIIDEANSRLLDVGGVKLRLLGLGGAVVMHKLFDNGEGRTTIAGGQGTMWTTLLQMGELVDTANRVYDPTETRIFVTHASPAREGLLNQLSVTLKADFSVSAGLHFRYGSSYNEFSVNPSLDHYRGKLAASKASFNDVWETVKSEVEPAVSSNDSQQVLLHNAIDIVQKMPSVANGGNPFGGPVGGPNAGGQVDESAFKNMWNFNLADAAFGYLVLEVEGGRIGTEMRAQGFNFAHRGGKQAGGQPIQQQNSAPVTSSGTPGGANALAASAPGVPAQVRSPLPPNQQPNQASSSTQNQLPPQPGKAPTGPARTNQSPASQVKPATPQSTASPGPQTTEKPVGPPKTEGTRNGTVPGDAKAGASPAPKTASPSEKKPAHGIYMTSVKDEDACRQLFSEDDRAKIVRIERAKNSALVVHFSTAEEVRAALDRQPQENKRREPGKPNMRVYHDMRSQHYNQGVDAGGAGRWQGSTRGGANIGGQGGYKSGGASDSDTGRGGRGAFRGGARGRGDRGDRGGRGGRGGRGSYNNSNNNNNKATTGGEGATSTASPAPTPVPAATPSGGDH
ncbi:MAG: hypothetical protein M1837_001614 [Sclerophora amabilis]|nr:MAG: hypothetical protein M1837_001614 [Sclerophora amabilis]